MSRVVIETQIRERSIGGRSMPKVQSLGQALERCKSGLLFINQREWRSRFPDLLPLVTRTTGSSAPYTTQSAVARGIY